MYTFMYQFSPLYTKYEKKYVSNLNQFDFQLRAMIGSTSPRGMKSGERTCNRPISFWIIKRHRYSYEYEDTAATLHWSALYFSASSTKHFLAVTNSKPRARSKSTVGQQPHLHCFFSAATLSRNPKISCADGHSDIFCAFLFSYKYFFSPSSSCGRATVFLARCFPRSLQTRKGLPNTHWRWRKSLVATFCNVRGLGEPRELPEHRF